MMSDLHEAAEEHKKEFAQVVQDWSDGKDVQFKVRPGATPYGSSDDWHPMENPWFHPNFTYRKLSEVEKLNLMAAMHEGDTD